TVAVDADVPQPVAALRQLRTVACEGVAWPGNGRTREVQRMAVCTAHQLDHVGVEQVVHVVDGGGERAHRRTGGRQRRRPRLDPGRGREGFVALQVHDQGVVTPAGDVGAFGEAVGAGGVGFRRERDLYAATVERLHDTFVVGGHPHLA